MHTGQVLASVSNHSITLTFREPVGWIGNQNIRLLEMNLIISVLKPSLDFLSCNKGLAEAQWGSVCNRFTEKTWKWSVTEIMKTFGYKMGSKNVNRSFQGTRSSMKSLSRKKQAQNMDMGYMISKLLWLNWESNPSFQGRAPPGVLEGK